MAHVWEDLHYLFTFGSLNATHYALTTIIGIIDVGH
jgi:hypothetical protein